MDKKDLQSRRDFFKRAGQAVLPVVGVIAMSQIPMVSRAHEANAEMGCSGCSGSCTGDCRGSCSTNCDSSCDGDCYNGCRSTCHGSCDSCCAGSCSGDCARGSY